MHTLSDLQSTDRLLIALLFLNTGVAGKSPNFYVYAHNSPILVKDPTGRIIPAIAIAAGYIAKRAAVGAVASVAVYYATSEITGTDTSLGGKKISHGICDIVAIINNNSVKCYMSSYLYFTLCVLDSWKTR